MACFVDGGKEDLMMDIKQSILLKQIFELF